MFWEYLLEIAFAILLVTAAAGICFGFLSDGNSFRSRKAYQTPQRQEAHPLRAGEHTSGRSGDYAKAHGSEPALGRTPAPREGHETAQRSESPGGSGELAVEVPTPSQDSTGLVEVTIYLLQDGDAESHAEYGRESRQDARFLIKQEIVIARRKADFDEIASIKAEYERSDVTGDRGERLREASAQYFATQVEGKLNISWWETRESFPLSSAAKELNKSADWLRGLVEGPLTNAAHAAGITGPVPSIIAGITADYATARLTAPIENAARACEIAGIAIGMATGAHPLVIVCSKFLAHDELGRAFEGIFERMLGKEDVSRPGIGIEDIGKPTTLDEGIRQEIGARDRSKIEQQNKSRQEIDTDKVEAAWQATLAKEGARESLRAGLRDPADKQGLGPDKGPNIGI